MTAQLIPSIRTGRTNLSYVIALLTLAMSSACTESGDLAGTDSETGAMRVTVIRSISASGLDITVRLIGPGSFPERTRTTFGGTLIFPDLPPGAYTVAATIVGFDCQSVSANVQAGQTTTASISCARTTDTTGAITGTVTYGFDSESSIVGATVNLTGPASRSMSAGQGGSFAFDELPPGTYTVAATDFGTNCQSVSVDVHAAQTTTVRISCTFRDFPIGSEIEGGWGYYRELRSQSGNCPPPLPQTGPGSIAFNSSNNTIEIVGLDPELTIVGTYDKDSGFYIGSGRAVLVDGSSIQTDVTLNFGFPNPWAYGVSPSTVSSTVFWTGSSNVWARRHSDPSGSLVCTEIYGAEGGHN